MHIYSVHSCDLSPVSSSCECSMYMYLYIVHNICIWYHVQCEEQNLCQCIDRGEEEIGGVNGHKVPVYI